LFAAGTVLGILISVISYIIKRCEYVANARHALICQLSNACLIVCEVMNILWCTGCRSTQYRH